MQRAIVRSSSVRRRIAGREIECADIAFVEADRDANRASATDLRRKVGLAVDRMCLGLTVSVPISAQQSLKFVYSEGSATRRESAFDTLNVTSQLVSLSKSHKSRTGARLAVGRGVSGGLEDL
jgi:hypothetical protein